MRVLLIIFILSFENGFSNSCLHQYYPCSDSTMNKGIHILKGRFNYDEAQFIGKKNSLINELLIELNLENESINHELMKKIDLRIVKYLNQSDIDSIFPSVIALVGEVIINKTRGRWLFKYNSSSSVWEPYITNGFNIYNPFVITYKTLKEDFPETGKTHLYDLVKVEMLFDNSEIDNQEIDLDSISNEKKKFVQDNKIVIQNKIDEMLQKCQSKYDELDIQQKALLSKKNIILNSSNPNSSENKKELEQIEISIKGIEEKKRTINDEIKIIKEIGF